MDEEKRKGGLDLLDDAIAWLAKDDHPEEEKPSGRELLTQCQDCPCTYVGDACPNRACPSNDRPKFRPTMAPDWEKLVRALVGASTQVEFDAAMNAARKAVKG